MNLKHSLSKWAVNINPILDGGSVDSTQAFIKQLLSENHLINQVEIFLHFLKLILLYAFV